MHTPLMPKATAIWLIENTSLTFDQIAEFCAMHPLEIKGIADDEVVTGMIGQDPIHHGQLTKEDIARCEKDPSAKLILAQSAVRHFSYEGKKKTSKYVPVARRQDKPDAIMWLIKNCPSFSDKTIIRLIGTTKHTIDSVREKTHSNYANIKPRDPVLLGLCTQIELDKLIEQVNFEEGLKGPK